VRNSQSPAGSYIVLDAVDVWSTADNLTTYTTPKASAPSRR